MALFPHLAVPDFDLDLFLVLQPKHPNSDAWDYAMAARDSRILEEAKASSVSTASLCMYCQPSCALLPY